MKPSIVIAITVFVLLTGLYSLTIIGRRYAKTNWGSKGLNILDGINTWFCQKYHRLYDIHIELPLTGPALLVSNHISGLDPLLLIAATRRPLRFMVAQEEYDRWWLKWLLIKVGCIPVKRDKNPTKALNESLKALRNGEVVVVFPQGGIVSGTNNKPLKKGAFVLASIAQVPLLCARINGVKAQGFTLLAPFIRSRAEIIKNNKTYLVTDDNLLQVMDEINNYFHS